MYTNLVTCPWRGSRYTRVQIFKCQQVKGHEYEGKELPITINGIKKRKV
jgi:hypothetical protein